MSLFPYGPPTVDRRFAPPIGKESNRSANRVGGEAVMRRSILVLLVVSSMFVALPAQGAPTPGGWVSA